MVGRPFLLLVPGALCSTTWALSAPFQVTRGQSLLPAPTFTPSACRDGVGGGRTDQGLAACPLPHRWLKDGHPLDGQDGVVVSEDGGTLLVTRVGLGHEGLYVCQGSSWAGLAQAEVQVSVHGESSIWGETCYPSHVSGRTWLAKGVGVLGLDFW